MKRLISFILPALLLATPASTQTAPKGKVLVVISSEKSIELRGGKTYQTGYFLNELTIPVKRLVEAGYSVTFANPKGNQPSMDIHSDSVDFFGKNQAEYQAVKTFHDNLSGLKSPRKLSEVVKAGLTQYDAVFFPGGHAPMGDLISDPAVRQTLAYFHRNQKPTALICHAPIALIATMPQADLFVKSMKQGNTNQATKFVQNWQYKGYKMTIFSTAEEQVSEANQLGGKMLFYPEAALKMAGGNVKVAKQWSSHVVQDRELITGQNPFSDAGLADKLLKAIEVKKQVN